MHCMHAHTSNKTIRMIRDAEAVRMRTKTTERGAASARCAKEVKGKSTGSGGGGGGEKYYVFEFMVLLLYKSIDCHWKQVRVGGGGERRSVVPRTGAIC